MGALISTCLSSSKGSTDARITDSSTWYPQPGQHISIRTFRELNPAPTSSPIWIRTETPSNGESFRSMEDRLEGVNNQPTTLTPRHLTAEINRRLSTYLGN
uniref:AC4 protein n=1 Tax=Tomato yellow leaf curl Yunnan virus TaxID=1335768 RepID=A0A191SEI2_9GEMI|nr:AC4 protein [Tomato yellow leaf curl Yunnan virus]QIH55826.1 C4 protein [Tomato yellow leaf curl Yunnan virus]QIH55834.1 C4 protein [Tomato yellow leaf curl Yunnan virus]QIH55840.1 C4 protein [Tomato yellow leaf curl Yunnan virus]